MWQDAATPSSASSPPGVDASRGPGRTGPRFLVSSCLGRHLFSRCGGRASLPSRVELEYRKRIRRVAHPGSEIEEQLANERPGMVSAVGEREIIKLLIRNSFFSGHLIKQKIAERRQ